MSEFDEAGMEVNHTFGLVDVIFGEVGTAVWTGDGVVVLAEVFVTVGTGVEIVVLGDVDTATVSTTRTAEEVAVGIVVTVVDSDGVAAGVFPGTIVAGPVGDPRVPTGEIVRTGATG
ncbi:MAG: hypothetical protein ABFC38_00395 [Methanospirillum sp.]